MQTEKGGMSYDRSLKGRRFAGTHPTPHPLAGGAEFRGPRLQGEYQTVLGLIGNTAKVDMEMIQSLDIVESVTRVSDPFKAVNRKVHRRIPSSRYLPPSGGTFALIAPARGDRGADHLWPRR